MSPPVAPVTVTRPVRRMAAAAAQCSTQATAYGKCIVVDYNSVHRDKCVAEFLKLKDCYLAAMKHK